MFSKNEMRYFGLIYVIVDYGKGSKVLQKAKECGMPAGTIFLGRGTVNSSILRFLSLYDERKEIVLMGADYPLAEKVLEELDRKFEFKKPHHGIAFFVSLVDIVGSSFCKGEEAQQERGEEKMYQLIMTIVNRGKAEDVIEAAQAAGSKGGTIVNARGSGIHESGKLFNMEIEPEKEMVLILSTEDTASAIVSSIEEKLEIDKPGNGIIFVQNVVRTCGIYEE